jgi:hypothetical protein
MVANRASASYLQLAQLDRVSLQRAPPGPFENQRPPATGNRVTAAGQQLQRLQTDLR